MAVEGMFAAAVDPKGNTTAKVKQFLTIVTPDAPLKASVQTPQIRIEFPFKSVHMFFFFARRIAQRREYHKRKHFDGPLAAELAPFSHEAPL